MLLHPMALFAAMREARAATSAAVSRAERSSARAIDACKTVKRKAAERCEEIESGEWRGPWMIATPLPPAGTRGGGVPKPRPE